MNTKTIFLDIFEVSLADDQPSCSRKKGRPVKEFDDCKDRSKRYKAADLASQYAQQQLIMASKSFDLYLIWLPQAARLE